jgi:hypothetical protein
VIFGIIGYFMKRLDLPMAPLVLGIVLGPLFEKALVQTSAIGDGNIGIVFTRPLALAVLAFAALQVFAPTLFALLLRRRRSRRAGPSDGGPATGGLDGPRPGPSPAGGDTVPDQTTGPRTPVDTPTSEETRGRP